MSIRMRLATLITGVVIVVVGLFGVIAMREVQGSALLATGDRLESVSRELSTLLATQARGLRAATRALAADSSVRVFLRAPDAAARAAATAAMSRRIPSGPTVIATEIWNADGARVLSSSDAVPPLAPGEAQELLAIAARSDAGAVGPIAANGDSLHYGTIAKVSDGATTIGYAVQRRSLVGSAESAKQLRDLVGSSAGLLVGNPRDNLWTDFATRAPGPAIDVVTARGRVEYERPGAGAMIGWVAPIGETSWTLVAEFPRATVLAPARAVLWRLVIVAAAILAVAAIGAWALSGSLTRPLSNLSTAASAIGGGDYSQRVPVHRADEIGALSATFNGMAESITAARSVLENQIDRVAASEQRLERVIGSSNAVIYELRFTDNGAVLEWISDNVTRVLGYDASEAHAPSWWWSNLHPGDREKLDRRMGPESYRDGSTEYRFRTKDGRFVCLREEQRVLRDADGRPEEVVGAWLDVSGQRELEEQFRQAQKMEAVGRIAGGVAHDFNNLLTVIRSYADLVTLEMADADPRREEMLEIRAAADRAAALARQLLAFSRKQVMLPRVFDLNEVVYSFEAMLSRTLAADVRPAIRLGKALGVIRADTGQVEQVLMNLALNAADAMPDGGDLTIETDNAMLDADYTRHHSGVEPGEYVMLAVSDTGTGMDKATLEHIFEPFFTTKPSGKGTGLGLSTVYGIVKQNGGHVWVYSEQGQGTTFKVYFPRVYEEVSAPRAVSDVAVHSEKRRPNETVLVVEDEPSVRTTLQRILQRQGYTVLPAAHGGEAMRISAERAGPIDLVISDLMMPEMSGREFVARFSAARPTTRVLFMSGYTDDDAQQRGLVDEQLPFIEKPFTVEQITRKVREVLDQA